MTQRQLMVVALSLYNALRVLRRDATVRDIVELLRMAWTPAWDNFDAVMTPAAIDAALAYLIDLDVVARDATTGLLRMAITPAPVLVRAPGGESLRFTR